MNVQEQIEEYITSQPEPKRSDMQELHRIILEVMPACKLWFMDAGYKVLSWLQQTKNAPEGASLVL